MSAEFDFISGYDISALTSVSQAQLMQMVNQIAPLSNKGMTISLAGPGTAGVYLADGTEGPDVAGNPRYANYIWLNTYAAAAPTPYYYNATTNRWNVATAGQVTALSQITDGLITIAKLSQTEGTARYLLRKNAANSALEYKAPVDIFQANELPVANLVKGTDNQFLRTISGVPTWSTYDPTASLSAVPISALAAGTNSYILRTSPTGTVEWASNNDASSWKYQS
jgi:hypothetical protein